MKSKFYIYIIFCKLSFTLFACSNEKLDPYDNWKGTYLILERNGLDYCEAYIEIQEELTVVNCDGSESSFIYTYGNNRIELKEYPFYVTLSYNNITFCSYGGYCTHFKVEKI